MQMKKRVTKCPSLFDFHHQNAVNNLQLIYLPPQSDRQFVGVAVELVCLMQHKPNSVFQKKN